MPSMSASHSQCVAHCTPSPCCCLPPALVANRHRLPSALSACHFLAPPLLSFAVDCRPNSAATDCPATSRWPHIATCSGAWQGVRQLASDSRFIVEASSYPRGGQPASLSIIVAACHLSVPCFHSSCSSAATINLPRGPHSTWLSCYLPPEREGEHLLGVRPVAPSGSSFIVSFLVIWGLDKLSVINNSTNVLLTLSRLGKRLVSVLDSSAHKSAYSGPINMIPSKKWICYVLPIHVACSIMQIGPLVPKLQQVTGLCGR